MKIKKICTEEIDNILKETDPDKLHTTASEFFQAIKDVPLRRKHDLIFLISTAGFLESKAVYLELKGKK